MNKNLGVFAIGLVAGSLIAGGIYLTLTISDSSNQPTTTDLSPTIQQEAQPASAATEGEYGVGAYIVGFVGTPDIDLIRSKGGRAIRQFNIINAVATSLPVKAVEHLLNNPNVAYVEPDIEISSLQDVEAMCRPGTNGWVHCPDKVKADKAPAQPTQTASNGVAAVGVTDTVAQTSAGAGVGIINFDTGIEPDHPDLAANIPANHCLIDLSSDRTKDCSDFNGHGTTIAGIIVADYNAIGIYGVANDAMLYTAKVLDRSGRGFSSDIISGLEAAVFAKNIDSSLGVINMPLGATVDSVPLHKAIIEAYKAGFVIVAAAGNDPTKPVFFPARYPEVIAVSALDQNTKLIAEFSSTGPEIELTAPGILVDTTYWGWGYTQTNGTSIAASHVSGMAALVIAHLGATTPSQVRTELATAALDLGLDPLQQGAGLVYLPLAL